MPLRVLGYPYMAAVGFACSPRSKGLGPPPCVRTGSASLAAWHRALPALPVASSDLATSSIGGIHGQRPGRCDGPAISILFPFFIQEGFQKVRYTGYVSQHMTCFPCSNLSSLGIS